MFYWNISASNVFSVLRRNLTPFNASSSAEPDRPRLNLFSVDHVCSKKINSKSTLFKEIKSQPIKTQVQTLYEALKIKIQPNLKKQEYFLYTLDVLKNSKVMLDDWLIKCSSVFIAWALVSDFLVLVVPHSLLPFVSASLGFSLTVVSCVCVSVLILNLLCRAAIKIQTSRYKNNKDIILRAGSLNMDVDYIFSNCKAYLKEYLILFSKKLSDKELDEVLYFKLQFQIDLLSNARQSNLALVLREHRSDIFSNILYSINEDLKLQIKKHNSAELGNILLEVINKNNIDFILLILECMKEDEKLKENYQSRLLILDEISTCIESLKCPVTSEFIAKGHAVEITHEIDRIGRSLKPIVAENKFYFDLSSIEKLKSDYSVLSFNPDERRSTLCFKNPLSNLLVPFDKAVITSRPHDTLIRKINVYNKMCS